MPQKPLTIVAEEPLTIVGEEPEAPTQAPTTQGGGPLDALGRALSGFWEQVNPVTTVQGIAQAVSSPIDTAKGVGQAQGQLYHDAAKAFQEGDYIKGARKGIHYLLPLIGPALDAQSEKAMQGDLAGAVGGTAGITANLAAPELAAGAVKVARTIPQAVPSVLRAGAERRIVDVIKPVVGQNKVRFGNKAADVAGQVAKEPGLMAWSREGLQTKLTERMEGVRQQFDTLDASRNPNQVIYSSTIERGLQQKLDRLKVNGVVPKPQQGRADVLIQAIKEVRQMPPTMSYQQLREFRKSYDGPASARYNQAITPDYLKVMAESHGAADVTGAVRDQMAKLDPRMSGPNAEFAWMRSADDVMRAAEETDRVRPKVGRRLFARWGTTAVGGAAGGTIGAVMGYVIGPLIDDIAAMSPTTKIATARIMTRLADALDAGNPTTAYVALRELAAKTGQAARLNELVKSGVTQPQMAPAMAGQQSARP